jgi:hypothetical protein
VATTPILVVFAATLMASGSGSCLGAKTEFFSEPSMVPPYASATITVSSIIMKSKQARSIDRAMST